MNRFAYENLCQWQKRIDRSPLLVRGARQVGKTFLVESFASAKFEHALTINFEHQPEYCAAFEASLDPVMILDCLSRFYKIFMMGIPQ